MFINHHVKFFTKIINAMHERMVVLLQPTNTFVQVATKIFYYAA